MIQTWIFRIACLSILSCFTFIGCGDDSANVASEAVVVYAVSTGADSTFAAEATMEPIVVMKGGKLSDPMPKVGETASADQYDQTLGKAYDQFFIPDANYSLLHNGQPSGTITVTPKAADESATTTGLVGKIKIKATTLNYGFALASNKEVFKAHNRKARVLTTAERAALLAHAKPVFAQNGFSGALLDSIDTQALQAYDLDGSGKITVVGDFILEHRISPEEGDPYPVKELLFIVAEKQGEAFSVQISEFGGGSNSTDPNAVALELIDVLDMDQDGTDELFVRRNGLEQYDYAIYKRQSGAWQVVYTGGGGGL